MEILKTIASQATFTLPIFDGKLLVEGRILTPAETEAAGLSSSLIASELLQVSKNSSGASSLMSLHKKLEEEGVENLDNDEMEHLLNYAKSIRPETLLQISDAQDKLLCQLIKRVSEDNGATWERLQFVTALDQQDPERNILWVGLLDKQDRDLLIEKAMASKKEAGEKLQTFRS
jgi:hypothetical protein